MGGSIYDGKKLAYMNKKFILFLMALFQVFMANGQINLKWQLGYSKTYTVNPQKFIEAKVPGAVQLDIAKAEKYGPHYYAENWKDYLWMEDQFYIYKTTFRKPSLALNERLFFISKGRAFLQIFPGKNISPFA